VTVLVNWGWGWGWIWGWISDCPFSVPSSLPWVTVEVESELGSTMDEVELVEETID